MRLSFVTALANLLAATRHVHVHGFGVARYDIKIVGMPGGAGQSLPAQYVKSFQRWNIHSTDETDSSKQKINAVLVPGTDKGSSSFVNPTSTLELWWPSDIKKLQVRPSLDVLLQNGIPSYVFAGLEVRVPPVAAADGKEWRNYGMNSQPLAEQWTSFTSLSEPGFGVECYLGLKSSSGNEDNDGLWEWTNLGARSSCEEKAKKTQTVLQTIGLFLSSMDVASKLSTGFHVLSFPLSKKWLELPALPEMKIDNKRNSPVCKIICFATAEQDMKDLLNMDESLLSMTGTSYVNVDVSETMPGSGSEYLPDSYRPLYIDCS